MSYTNKFIAADGVIAHIRPMLQNVNDQFLLSKYAGFMSVSAVTVYELAVKEIFIEFARKKHQSYGVYVENKFERINGRIKLNDLKDEHIKSFGPKYLDKFKKKIDDKEKQILRAHRYSIKSSYSNLIECRHKFVHVGQPTLSATEVMDSYERGKEVLNILYEVMKR